MTLFVLVVLQPDAHGLLEGSGIGVQPSAGNEGALVQLADLGRLAVQNRVATREARVTGDDHEAFSGDR